MVVLDWPRKFESVLGDLELTLESATFTLHERLVVISVDGED